MTLSAGSRLGPYEVLGLLGAGGMGKAYRARDPRLGREVAVKVLPEAVARDADRLLRFEREARAVATINHPNILTLFDVRTHGREDAGDGGAVGVPYVVRELLEGETLRVHVTPYGAPLEALLAPLDRLTNVRVVEDAASPSGYTVDLAPFPGWKDVPTW